MSIWLGLACAPLFMWLALLLLPWQPWRNRERIEAAAEHNETGDDVTVLIPARDEAAVIARTLAGVQQQGDALRVILVDDGSNDGTSEAARRAMPDRLTILPGNELPPGWSGKLWALEQARRAADSRWLLLLDADIELTPGCLAALLDKARDEQRALVSVMASLRMQSFWERLLLPAFVYFFRILYPFALANRPRSRVAAAAGGCVLLERRVLDSIGGFGAIRDALIDDCALAAASKRAGFSTWIGLSRSVRSLRPYDGLGSIWHMVARNAFIQLRSSWVLLLSCSALLVTAYWLPMAALAFPDPTARLTGAGALLAMLIGYLPILRFYRLSPLWALTLPLIGTLYLLMTWSSALRALRGVRSQWKGRVYDDHGLAT